MTAAVVDRSDLDVAVKVVSVQVEVVDPNVGKMDVSIEVRQVVFVRPAFDFTLCPVRSAIGIRVAAIALVEPFLILAFKLVIEGDAFNPSVAIKKAIDLVLPGRPARRAPVREA